MDRPSRPLLLAALLALAALATVAGYAPAFRAGFVDIDDADYVPENEVVLRGLHADGVVWAFSGAHAGNWIPLAWTSHMLDVTLFGAEPAGHHAVNVALHVANALLLFAALASLTGSTAPSFAAAALFALHPAHVESVAWVSQRKTTLSATFALLAIWAYARWARRGGRAAYGASLLAFAASLLAKQSFVPLPFALLLLDWWPLRRFDRWPPRRLVVEKLPYLALAIAASVATLLAQGEAIERGAAHPLPVRLGNAVLSLVRYVELFFWPAKLAVFRPLYDDDVTAVKVAAAALALLAITAAAFALRRRRYLLVGWLWFLGMLVPVIGLVQVGGQAMADRYAYAPFWGLGVAVVWTVWELVARDRTRRRAAGVALALVCGALGVLTYRQASAWRDSIALFEDAVADTDRNFLAERALAGQYFERGDYALALAHARKGAEHRQDLGDVLPVYGMALYQTGAKAEAIAKLEESMRVAPENPMGASNLGWIYLQEGDYERARDALAHALALAPDNARWHELLGRSELGLGRLDEAAQSFERATALDPQNFDAWIERARTLGRLGRFDASAVVLVEALAAAQTFPEDRRAALVSTLHRYRGEMLVAAGDPQGGAAEYAAGGRRDDALRVLREALDRARAEGDAALASALEARLRAIEKR